jgi:hypothetical protein
MSFQMEVRVEKVLVEGAYAAKLKNVEKKDTKFGERLMWTFVISAEDDAEVVGFTSMSPSTRGNAYQWALAIMGEIDPKQGWGPEDLIGRECTIVLEVAKDAQGVEKNKVTKVKPAKTNAESQEIKDFANVPF